MTDLSAESLESDGDHEEVATLKEVDRLEGLLVDHAQGATARYELVDVFQTHEVRCGLEHFRHGALLDRI